ncbi:MULTISPECIES: hypothetical protein [unclassified Amycolatopsis]|uniref:hypothetical protein n=1 Tax=unclassified Amycolatopsis TaxID=2618356 RepID=UPI001C6A8244|nr:hypothetical protein [Amycolatopsis sp. DSM 110486]QYN25586.1 hypothetical protein K1T34_26105 [Amycolatopsis sp. DSM 110486]
MSRWRTSTRTNTAARVITGIGALFAFIEVLYLVMLLAGANAANGFFIFIRSLADPLALFFPGLFPVSNPDLAVILDYGLAAVFWLVVSGIIARLVAR